MIQTRPMLAAGLASAAVFLIACSSPGVWERSVRTGPERAAPLASTTDVTVREVPWDRVQTALLDLEREIAASDIHPDEWPDPKRDAAKARLLRGLQISQDPRAVAILGTAQFRTTESLTATDDELRRIARRLGANMVVHSERVLGKADRIVDRPASANTHGTGWWREGDGSRSPDSYHESRTTWIPIRISVDETGAVAYFLRV
ncbi:MAG TPA: hypothetical protein VD971_07990 [Phycisphaerales bacterium]|nr:hypothetical protein [Phycisphaerales bacterium]